MQNRRRRNTRTERQDSAMDFEVKERIPQDSSLKIKGEKRRFGGGGCTRSVGPGSRWT